MCPHTCINECVFSLLETFASIGHLSDFMIKVDNGKIGFILKILLFVKSASIYV